MFGITLSPTILKIIGVVALVIGLIFCFELAQRSAEKRGYEKAQNEYTQKALIAQAAARKREQELQTKLEDAQNEARNREAVLMAAADSARSERDGMRDELTSISDRLSRASADSLRKYAATANSVLKECTVQLTEMARKADGHASDSMMLQTAWPK